MPNSDRSAIVFVVDDDEAVRDSVQLLLETEGYRAVSLASAQALLDRLAPAESGCVIADVRMPDMTGLELQDRLSERRANLPVIIVTGHADVPMAVRAMKAGAVDFIEKPFAHAAIIAAVERALGGRAARQAEAPQAPAEAARLAALTQREQQVLRLLVRGRPNKLIAYELDISPRTVEIHRARVMEKTGADSLAHLVRLALAAGIPVEPE